MLPYKIGILTQGCRLNQSESASLKSQISESSGFTLVAKPEHANIIVIHTCMVTNAAETDLKKQLNKINRLNPNAKIALIGCAAQIRPETADYPSVKWVIGNADKMNLVQLISESLKSDQTAIIRNPIKPTPFTQPYAAADTAKTRANLKIQDGCNARCSYCIVPYARGPERSREFDDILREADTLVKAGYKEIVLTGIHIARYKHQTKILPDIIHALEAIPKLERIRLSSIEPDDQILNQIIATMTRSKKCCRFLHLPIQNASNRILKRMNRSYTIESASKLIEQAVAQIPGIAIGLDLITGFPTESESDFNENKVWLQNMPIANAHIFSYSERPHTQSLLINPKVEIRTIKARHSALQAIANEKQLQFYQSQSNQPLNVLFEEKKGAYWQGLTDNYIRVRVNSGQNLKNKILPIKLTTLHAAKIPWMMGEGI